LMAGFSMEIHGKLMNHSLSWNVHPTMALWFPLLNLDFQESVAGLGRDEIDPDQIHGWFMDFR
jgi:hypothetical protein